MSIRSLIACSLFLPFAAIASGSGVPRTPSTPLARVYFISPSDGQVLKTDVVVRFGLTGMGVAPAGTAVEGTGHHHLIIDSALPAMDQPLPKDDKHLHFGKGQTEAMIRLGHGKHTLQLVFADANHVPHNPALVSEKITVTVR